MCWGPGSSLSGWNGSFRPKAKADTQLHCVGESRSHSKVKGRSLLPWLRSANCQPLQGKLVVICCKLLIQHFPKCGFLPTAALQAQTQWAAIWALSTMLMWVWLNIVSSNHFLFSEATSSLLLKTEVAYGGFWGNQSRVEGVAGPGEASSTTMSIAMDEMGYGAAKCGTPVVISLTSYSAYLL